jgi:hypothetical protein
MERETKEYVTPRGVKVLMKTYLTAREAVPVVDAKDLTDVEKSQKLAAVAIVSLDGSAENVADRMLDLPIKEYSAILTELTALIADLKETK